ncbi:MAG: hypothetical protein JWM14_1277 [Chitinophagaceae bacterium]|nr:hypothetical protein [Chitinophagaceae bacterium]
MKENKGWLVSVLVIALMALSISVWNYFNSPKLAYVNNKQLFADFVYKKELEKELTKIEHMKKSVLDSLRLDLEFRAEQLGGKKKTEAEVSQFRTYEQQYLFKEKQFTETYDKVAKEYTDQVWKQLNQYVKDYGQAHSYNMVFGTTNSGEIMYADEAEDLTDEILEFANSRYQGNHK